MTGFHALATGFGQVRETIFLKNDERKAFVEGGTHHYESKRKEFYKDGNPDIDYVLSTRELARLIKQFISNHL